MRVVAAWCMLWLLSWTAPCSGVVGTPEAADTDPQQRHIEQLVERLGDQNYFVRQRAQAELAKMGFDAFEALSAAENHDDLEIAARAKYLIRLMHVDWTLADDPPEVKRYLEGYESLAPGDRLERMRRLSALPDGVGIPALCRLVRFEKSGLLSKHAAVKIIGRLAPEEPPGAELVEVLRKGVDRSRRTASGWLAAYARFHDQPPVALDAWSKLVDQELAVLRRTPERSSPAVVAVLVRIQTSWLAKVGRKQDAVAAMWKLIDLEKGNPDSLRELVGWLVKQEAWDAIEGVAERFTDLFSHDAMLLYTLAQAQAELGDRERADETARRAKKLNSGLQLNELFAHLVSASLLERRGLFRWSEEEYRYVIASAVTGQELTARARFGLSEMLHDQGEDLRAAETLQPLADVIAKLNPPPEAIAGRTPAAVLSRMNHFYALHWAGQGDRKKQRQHLEAAIEADPTDVDVLIACYRLPEADPPWRTKIKDLIKKTADELRDEIAAEPEQAIYYNQFAWLIGNTEGDFAEALRSSKKSIQLEPDSGGYYDTLGHVYYGMGDYANAVKYQTKAAEMVPTSGLIRRQFELFAKALAEQNGKEPQADPATNGDQQKPAKPDNEERDSK